MSHPELTVEALYDALEITGIGAQTISGKPYTLGSTSLEDIVQAVNAAQSDAPVQWTDDQIVALLASLGIDADKSKYGFPELQVHTTVPGVRQILERAKLAAPEAPRCAGCGGTGQLPHRGRFINCHTCGGSGVGDATPQGAGQ